MTREDKGQSPYDARLDQYLAELSADPVVGGLLSEREQESEETVLPALAKFRRKQMVQTIRSAAALEILRFMPKLRAMLDNDKVSWSTKLKALQLLLQYGVGEQRSDKIAEALAERGGVILLPPENPQALPIAGDTSLPLLPAVDSTYTIIEDDDQS